MVQAVKASVADDLMIKRVETIAPNAAVIDAARLMQVKKLQYLIVVDGERRVAGVVTQCDILQYVSEPHGEQEERQDRHNRWESDVSKLITQDLMTVKGDVPLREVVWMLVINRMECLAVIDDRECLIGVVTVPDVIKHLTDGVPSSSDKGFQFYIPPDEEDRPNLPAFFRRSTGTLVLPVDSLGDVDTEMPYARLGYDASNGRIMVKLVAQRGPGDQRVTRETLNRDGLYLVVPASEFVAHFHINPRIRAYDIACHSGDIFLMPRR